MRNLAPPQVAEMPWRIIFLMVAIATFGGLVLYSAANGSMQPWAMPHMMRFTVLLVGILVVVRRLPLDFMRVMSLPAYIACLALLILVEVIGQIGGGSQRWLNLGFITIQPSELMKIAIVILLARFYEQLPTGMTRTWRAVVPPLVVMALPAALVLIQPDLDAAVVLVAGGIVIMFLAGLPMIIFGAVAGVTAVVAPFAYFFLLEPYQQTRLTSFLSPESDPLGAGYHVIQSKIAIGSGGLFGKGFLNGSQSHLAYLPEHHTDLVFATLAEEWGLVGGLLLLFAYFLLLRWCVGVAMKSNNRFGRLTAMGLTATIFFYIAMNVLTATGLTPVMGMPLPLVSHGGSAMMTVMLSIGIIMAIDRDNSRSTPRR